MDAIVVIMVLNYYVLHSPLIVLKELEIVGDSQVTARLYLVLYDILLDYHFIHKTTPLEAQLSKCLDSLL